MAKRTGWLIALTVACALAAVLLPPLAQPLDYHEFADRRGALGIANFLDVASNAGFLLAGIAGLVVVAVRRSAFEHLAAAASGFVVCWALARRTLERRPRPVAEAAA